MELDAETQAGVTLIVSLLFSFLLIGIPLMKILNKAGYSRAWILLMFIPIVNLIMLWVFAFAQWPRLAPTGYGAAQYPYPQPGQPYGQPPYPQQAHYPPQPPYQQPPR